MTSRFSGKVGARDWDELPKPVILPIYLLIGMAPLSGLTIAWTLDRADEDGGVHG